MTASRMTCMGLVAVLLSTALPPGVFADGNLPLRTETVDSRKRHEKLSKAQEKYLRYVKLARAIMGEKRFDRYHAKGFPILLALRRSTRSNDGYPDRFIFLSHGRATVLPGSTEPSYVGTGISMVKPGVYEGVPNGPHNGAPSWWIKTLKGSGEIPDRRDSDGDGIYSGRGESYNSKATEILLHVGRSSTGCLNYRPEDTGKIVYLLGGTGHTFILALERA